MNVCCCVYCVLSFAWIQFYSAIHLSLLQWNFLCAIVSWTLRIIKTLLPPDTIYILVYGVMVAKEPSSTRRSPIHAIRFIHFRPPYHPPHGQPDASKFICTPLSTKLDLQFICKCAMHACTVLTLQFSLFLHSCHLQVSSETPKIVAHRVREIKRARERLKCGRRVGQSWGKGDSLHILYYVLDTKSRKMWVRDTCMRVILLLSRYHTHIPYTYRAYTPFIGYQKRSKKSTYDDGIYTCSIQWMNELRKKRTSKTNRNGFAICILQPKWSIVSFLWVTKLCVYAP